MIYTARLPKKRVQTFPHFFNGLLNAPVRNVVYNNRTKTVPAANVVKLENSYEMHLAVPGMSKQDIEIKVEKDQLTISAQRTAEEQNFRLKEFDYNNFQRVFTLPEDVNTEAMSAKVEDGILKIEMPLIPEAEPMKIKIK